MRMNRRSIVALVGGAVVLAVQSLTASASTPLPSGLDGAQQIPPSAPAVCGQLSVVTTPNYPTSSNHLNAVAALAADNVWAVGDYYDGVTDRTVIQHWTGSFWGFVQDAE